MVGYANDVLNLYSFLTTNYKGIQVHTFALVFALVLIGTPQVGSGIPLGLIVD